MRRLLLAIFVLALFSGAPRADAQQACFGSTCPAGGATGGITSGSAGAGCTAYSIVTIDASGNLACLPSSVVNGNVSTAGRSIFTLSDTITGSSATSNFLNVTGTFPATVSAEASGALFSIGFDNDATKQNLVKILASGTAGADSTILALDNATTTGKLFEARDNGTAVFTIADGGLATASTGLNITGSTSFTTPQLAVSSATTTGFGYNTEDTNHYYASAGTGLVEIGVNAGAQGFAMNRTGNCNGNTTSCGYNFSVGPGNVVDAFITSEAAAIIQLGADLNGSPVSQTLKAHDGVIGTDLAGASLTVAGGRGTGTGSGGNLVFQTAPSLGTGTTSHTLQQRDTIVAKQFNLTSGSIATFAVATLGNDTHAGGSIEYCVYGADATTAVSECGRADYSAIDVTAGAGGEICTFTKVGTPAQAVSGATLAVTFTGTTGTDLCSLRVTSTITTIASPVNHYIKYRIINNGLSSTNIVTPQ